MLQTQFFNEKNKLKKSEKQNIINFLFDHLGEYGDPKKEIQNAIDYSLKEIPSFGGFTMLLKNENEILGAVVINQTGMKGYIPENILVYIATHRAHRGKGLGKKLMKEAISEAQGDIALHVEASNPARFLYENLGFKNPYLEMRLKK